MTVINFKESQYGCGQFYSADMDIDNINLIVNEETLNLDTDY